MTESKEEPIGSPEVWGQLSRWERKHRGARLVIKYGAVIEHESLKNQVAEEIFLLSLLSMYPNIVHGGGKYITAELNHVFDGYQPEFTPDGDRVTDGIKQGKSGETEVEVVHRVLSGITYEIAELLEQYTNNGMPAPYDLNKKKICTLGTSPENPFFICRQKSREAKCVGKIESLEGKIHTLYSSGVIPVICPVGYGGVREGGRERYNVNGDRAAAYLASYQNPQPSSPIPQASELIFITDVDGVCNLQDELISSLTIDEARTLMERGVIKGGMRAKVGASIQALEAGVKQAHIINRRKPYSLLTELFTDGGTGTIIVKER